MLNDNFRGGEIDLNGRTALLVGASRGIGLAAAQLFAKAGANVVISARNESELMEAEFALNNIGGEVLALAADAAIEIDVKSLVNSAVERFGKIDYLVHAAGAGILKPFAELTAEDLDELLTANVVTAFNVLQAVLPVMAENKFGRVVAIPGILGKAPMMQASAYCAAKYALTGMIKCLKDEYKRFGIRFSLMHFGGVDSNFWDDITMKVQRDKMLSINAAANAVFFAATQEGEGVLAEIVLMPENHQLV